MLEMLVALFKNIGLGFYNIGYAITHWNMWLDWSEGEALLRFVYYGASSELFFVIFDLFLVITIVGFFKRGFLWGIVRGSEAFANGVGRFAGWAVIIMVIQQIMVVFLQSVFRVSQISISPFGYDFTRDLSWYGDELKLYNAILVCLCASYTFVQGGHVRVDLFYAGMKHRSKKIVDMLGSLFFIIPFTSLVWLYSWFFMWRNLLTPKVSANNTLEALMRKAQILKWNVETTSFSPSGFDAYFIFKVLMVSFAGMMFIQGLTFFWRSLLEYIEGPESVDKYLQKDVLGDETADQVAAIH